MKLKTTAGHMISLIDIFESNVDEPSDYLKSTRKYWKRIEFDVDVSSGSLNLGQMKINREFAKREMGN